MCSTSRSYTFLNSAIKAENPPHFPRSCSIYRASIAQSCFKQECGSSVFALGAVRRVGSARRVSRGRLERDEGGDIAHGGVPVELGLDELRLAQRQRALLEILELVVLLFELVPLVLPLEPHLLVLILAKSLDDIERPPLRGFESEVSASSDEDLQSLRVGIASCHVHWREPLAVNGLDVSTKLNQKDTSWSKANSCHKMKRGPTVAVPHIWVRAHLKRIKNKRQIGGLGSPQEHCLFGRRRRCLWRSRGGRGRWLLWLYSNGDLCVIICNCRCALGRSAF
mmetsp:Transcript_19497/g.41217  ORF Transcript_19497/g.41217 Transcript_19497/m.41217 type:complete len:281 (+) Transcript_19497:249-1091(+)